MIKNLSGINTNCEEGRLFMAALAKLTIESQTDKHPDEVVAQCRELAEKMFEDNPLPQEDAEQPTFKQMLTKLINSYSKENGSNTPDFILADYIEGCLTAFDAAVSNRTAWYGPDGKGQI